MKGIVFNLLETCFTAEHGPDEWDDLLDQVGLDGAYTSLGSYPDDEAFKLVSAAAGRLGCSEADVLRWFGRRAMAPLAQRYPEFFQPHASTRSFVLTLNEIIHPEVLRLYPGASVPTFRFETPGPELLVMHYHSSRRMCGFAEGLVLGAADHFGDRVSIAQPRCMLTGADACMLVLSFQSA